jgi:hypothetical protein
MEECGFHWTDCHETWYLSNVWKSVKDIHVSVKSDRNNGYFTWSLHMFMIISRWIFFKWEIFQTKVVETIKTHISCLETFLPENYAVYKAAEKVVYSWTDHRWQYMMHALCMMDNYGYKHTLRICNIHCFCTGTMLTWTCLSVESYAHTLSVFFIFRILT